MIDKMNAPELDKKNDCNTVNERIMDMIVGKLKADDRRLPPEEQLCRDLGISRTQLRENLKAFETKGFISTRQGSGRYVQIPSMSDQISSIWAIILKAEPYRLMELLEVRSLLEINTIPNAIERITNQQLQHLAKLVERMKELAHAGKPFVKEDRAFHATLFSSTGNQFMEQLLTTFWDLYELSISDFYHEDLMYLAESHEGIMAAFARKDADAAQKLLLRQFADARYRITVDLAKRDMQSKQME